MLFPQAWLVEYIVNKLLFYGVTTAVSNAYVKLMDMMKSFSYEQQSYYVNIMESMCDNKATMQEVECCLSECISLPLQTSAMTKANG